MGTVMDDEIKRWTARRKSALVLEIIQGKTTVAEASRAYDLPPSEIETWIDEGKRGMENALRARKEIAVPAGRGREMIETIRQGLKADGYTVSISQWCRWFEVARRTVYYRPTRKPPTIQDRFCAPIKQMIEENPSFGYRTVAHLLCFNKNTVQRIFQLKGWQVKKRPVGFRPRSQAMPSVAKVPNERWATDLCRVWSGRDGWTTLALVMDCCSRELLGWHLSRSGRSKTAKAALEQALVARFGTLGRVPKSFLLRSDNGLVFTSHSYTKLVRGYGLRQEFITPHTPEQNGMVERLIRTLKEQCVHRHRFETLQHASRVIGDWVGFYNESHPHKALQMKSPREFIRSHQPATCPV